MATYLDKLEDSFITKLKIFLFTKAFDGNVLDYIKDTDNNLIEDFRNFELTIDIANVYSSQYYQFEKEMDVDLNAKRKKSQDITTNLLEESKFLISKDNLKHYLGEYYNKLFELYKAKTTWTKAKFDELNNSEHCSYCGISKTNIWEYLGKNGLLHNKRSETRGYNLEIDRKYPNLEYSEENCCMSCYWCNNAKTDEYIPSEFKEIARGINHVWNKRLEKAGISEKIIFPEDSAIWEDSKK